MTTSKILLFALLVGMALCKTKDEWQGRSIYQIVTDRFSRGNGNNSPCYHLGNYCGGTFKGIKENLDYIQGMGFDAIWISPMVDNKEGGYHGYWFRDWYKVNSHFGSADELKDLISEMHRRDMWMMFDVVANHVAPVGEDFSSINPFNRAEHYHSTCQIGNSDFCGGNQDHVENCRLANLPDLNQNNPWVRSELIKWVKWLVSEFSIDGIRIDTVAHVPKDFWSEFTRAAGVYTVGEVFCYPLNYDEPYLDHMDGLLNYALFWSLRNTFKGSSFRELSNRIKEVQGRNYGSKLKYCGLFVDNHDNDRFLHNYGNWDSLNGALLFTLFFPGIPIVYYGDEQGYGGGHDPNNREPLWTNMDPSTSIYQFLKKANKVRKDNRIWEKEYREIWVDENVFAFVRGDVLVIFTNGGEAQSRDFPNLPWNGNVCNQLKDGDCVNVSGGSGHFSMAGNEVKIYKQQLICIYS
eukprot:TRINITY_DN38922_c0_g1_i1.p1 TRINITY_DN38922_c0_g1~~TRINITY_DN38922_c0_g1_i1.p1  ORF type:complete len:464 (+),score=87.64 TRINITY_DN38922_c0_g1_i1:3-1394(+)